MNKKYFRFSTVNPHSVSHGLLNKRPMVIDEIHSPHKKRESTYKKKKFRQPGCQIFFYVLSFVYDKGGPLQFLLCELSHRCHVTSKGKLGIAKVQT
jgi:hypothetical protein